MTDQPAFAEGERVVLRKSGGESLLLRVTVSPQVLEGQGVVDTSGLIGRSSGSEFGWAGASYRALRPSLPDILNHLERRAQIITPKDALHLLYLAGVGPGGLVLEAGSGSGSMTTVLAHFVGRTGRVVSYDRRADFLEVVRRNLSRAGLEDRVDLRLRDVAAEGFDVTGADSVILDLPEPWTVLGGAREALKIGGYLGVYTPTYNQLERTVLQLRQVGFEEVQSLELLERALHVGDGGTRPEFDMLGHTGFLTGARRGG